MKHHTSKQKQACIKKKGRHVFRSLYEYQRLTRNSEIGLTLELENTQITSSTQLQGCLRNQRYKRRFVDQQGSLGFITRRKKNVCVVLSSVYRPFTIANSFQGNGHGAQILTILFIDMFLMFLKSGRKGHTSSCIANKSDCR